ncbi:MAG: hypothetical protein J6J64_03955 [Alistipes sp.]|nr:hypothetical protein [Alistipes sp.]
MAKCIVNSAWMLIVALAAVSCRGTGQSVEMHDTEQSTWSRSEEFVYINEDSVSQRDIALVVRYGSGYVADSVALTILSISPDSMVVEEPFTLHIPHLGDMRPAEQRFTYRRRVVLGHKGEYLFRLSPTVPVEGISSVGIAITEPQITE